MKILPLGLSLLKLPFLSVHYYAVTYGMYHILYVTGEGAMNSSGFTYKQSKFPGFLGILSVTKCQCRRLKRHRFRPWVRKIPWRGAWKLSISGESPWTEEPGGLQSTGLQKVGHNESHLAHIQFRFPEEAKSLSCGLYTKSQLKAPNWVIWQGSIVL